MSGPLDIVVLGLSITSSWGNGHATTYRGLVRELVRRGHDVLFLERDVPWYAGARDLPRPPWGRTELYGGLDELRERFGARVAGADLVVLGSFVPEGIAVGEWVLGHARGVRAFYDIDTPLTLARLADGGCEYLAPGQVPRFDLYLSFSAGPALTRLSRVHGARRAVALLCAVDPEQHRPLGRPPTCDLGYMGTYSSDRQPGLERLLLQPARRRPDLRFAVAGPQYPRALRWPDNVRHVEHVPPPEHGAFYGSLRFALNLTRADMARSGFSPSVRLFEAAACGTPVISDWWPGVESVLEPGREILLARSGEEVLHLLTALPEEQRRQIAARARDAVLASHTAAHRAEELERAVRDVAASRTRGSPVR